MEVTGWFCHDPGVSDGTSGGAWLPRRSLGGLGSVIVHAGLLAWLGGRAAPVSDPEPRAEPAIEWLEVSVVEHGPLARKAESEAGREGSARAKAQPARSEASTKAEPVPAKPRPLTPRGARPTPDGPTTEEPAPAEPAHDEPAHDEPASAPLGPPESTSQADSRGAGEGHGGALGSGSGDGELDHSAYGAEIVRIVKAEIDRDPVPGISAKDSIEIELEILPSGRLARRGMGKFDYAVVLASSVGPLRTRGILRRIASASRRFPPHPTTFPRQRYVVGFTVCFHDQCGTT